MILGTTGMLGRYVTAVLRKAGHKLRCPTRDELWPVIDGLWTGRGSVPDVIVNCVGAIPQRSPSSDDYRFANTLLPQRVAQLSQMLGIEFIHITTDCVFSGKKGNYSETDPHDADTLYGRSKSLGEPDNCTVIRTSIIGESTHGKGLLEWVRSHKAGSKINGYTNHRWNGVTCLELAHIIRYIIDTKSYWKGVRHYFSEPVTKAQLVSWINMAYYLGLEVIPVADTHSIDRTLTGSIDNFRGSILQQLKELQQFDGF